MYDEEDQVLARQSHVEMGSTTTTTASTPSDQFKALYKKYRPTSCGEFTKLNKDCDLVDLNNLDQCESLVEPIDYGLNEETLNGERFSKFKEHVNLDELRFYSLKTGPPGLILIPSFFKTHYCRELFNQLLHTVPKDYYSQLKSNVELPIDPDKISQSNLRWFTFGAHYDWTNKTYYKNDRNEIPPLLDDLLSCIKELLNLDLKLEAGIVNFYNCKSKLNPHSDCREENLEPPLLSISLGEKALFLIGRTNNRYDDNVTPIVLRDGDLMIMSNESRLAYHSVIKIVCTDSACKRKFIKRININVRQVY